MQKSWNRLYRTNQELNHNIEEYFKGDSIKKKHLYHSKKVCKEISLDSPLFDVYKQNSDYAKYDNSNCEWNQFLKDFCADEKNSIFQNKLKVASILWKKVGNSTHPKVYTHHLVDKNMDLLSEYL